MAKTSLSSGDSIARMFLYMFTISSHLYVISTNATGHFPVRIGIKISLRGVVKKTINCHSQYRIWQAPNTKVPLQVSIQVRAVELLFAL